MTLLSCVVLSIISIIFLSSMMLTSAWIDYDLVIVETLNNTKEPMEYHITKKRANRYTFVIDGTVAFTDLTGYDAELKIYHSAPDSSKFVLSPMKLPRTPVDKSLNSDYRKYLMNQVHEFSDLPYTEDEKEDIYPKFLDHSIEIVIPFDDNNITNMKHMTKGVIHKLRNVKKAIFGLHQSRIHAFREQLTHAYINGLCWENSKFTVNKFMLYNTTIPADLADGTYKCYLFIYKGMDVINGIYVMLRLY